MENRDAASLFLIFLHSVGHLGGDVRCALWETRGSVRGETNRRRRRRQLSKNTDEGDRPYNTGGHVIISTPASEGADIRYNHFTTHS